MSRRVAVLAGAGGFAAAVAWARTHPSACPYSQRWMLELPRPFVTTERLRAILAPRPGERLLELGPGVGHDALAVAEAIRPDGTLDVFDIQQEMLDDLMQRARERGLDNLAPTQGDARLLPYPDAAFDGAYLITVLGEIPDQGAALRELRRVIRPGGRLVLGEVAFDPHFVTFGALRERAEAAGFEFERRLGPPALGYFARFERP
jgi:ubiquinone/menaquinone biosynthesis C-methylase UbiE